MGTEDGWTQAPLLKVRLGLTMGAVLMYSGMTWLGAIVPVFSLACVSSPCSVPAGFYLYSET